MDKNIKKILDDLYAIDPSFKQHEAALIKIISQLLVSRPDTRLDQRFVRELRQQLLAQTQTNAYSLFSLTTMRKLTYSFVGAGVATLIIVPALYFGGFFGATPLGNLIKDSDLSLALQPMITQVQANAFGQLNAEGGSPTPAAAEQFGGFGGGGGAPAMGASPSASLTVAADTKDAARMIAPETYYQFRYVYKGEPLELADSQLPVYRRLTDGLNLGVQQIVKTLNFGFVNLSSFGNAKLEQFSFVEDKKNGLRVNVSLMDGSVNIYENLDYTSYQPRQLTESDVPADSEVIALADAFLKKHGISTANFGQPIIRDEWRVYYLEAQARSEIAWVPNVLTVTYPQLIDGQTVYDQGGSEDGLSVNVDIERKIAVGIWNLRTQQYESSLYDMETNVDRILKFAEQGGTWPMYYDPQAKILEVELGTPTLALVKIIDYRNSKVEELLVPGLIFPVTKAPETAYGFYQRSVVIPLAQDILDQTGNVDGPKIMPLTTEPGVAVPEADPAIAL